MAYLDIVNNTDGFNHIALFYPADSGNPIFLTRGAWEVADKILGFDSEKQIVYVLALADDFSVFANSIYVLSSIRKSRREMDT